MAITIIAGRNVVSQARTQFKFFRFARQPNYWLQMTKFLVITQNKHMVGAETELNMTVAGPDDRNDALVENPRPAAKPREALAPEVNPSEQPDFDPDGLPQGIRAGRDNGKPRPAQSRRSSGRHFKKLGIIKDTSPVDVWDARLSIEPNIARAAALKATPREIHAIRAAHEAADPKIFTPESDNEFHRKVAAASHNTLWIIFMDLLTEITLTESFQMQLPPFTSVTGFEHHEEILQALTARDAVAAERAMHAHLTAIRRWVLGLPA